MSVSKITKDQSTKIVKAAAYVGLSAVIGYLIAVVAEQPELFGVFTPIVNIVLVTIKQAFTQPE